MLPDVVFFLNDGALDPTVDSAYLNPAVCLQESGYAVQFLALAPLGSRFRPRMLGRWRELRKRIESGLGPGSLHVRLLPPSRFNNLWTAEEVLAKWLRKHFPKKSLVLHCHGAQSASTAIEASRNAGISARVIFYCLGPHAEEYLYGKSKFRGPNNSLDAIVERRRKDEKKAFELSDVVVCLSRTMFEYGKSLYGLTSCRSLYIPFFLDFGKFAAVRSERDSIRSSLGFSDHLVIVYCGSLHPWQRFPQVIRVFQSCQKVQENSRLLLLTPAPDIAFDQAVLGGVAPNCITSLNAKWSDVPKFLASADIGIIGRGLDEPPSVVNAISSPIKFGEYLAAGCPVILAPGVGDFSRQVTDQELGVVAQTSSDYSISEFVQRYVSDPHGIRKRCIDFAEENLSDLKYMEKLKAAYDFELPSSVWSMENTWN